MIFSEEFAPTRESYRNRNLNYATLKPGNIQVFNGFKPWVDAVKAVAINFPEAIDVAAQWKTSESESKAFVIWYDIDQPESV